MDATNERRNTDSMILSEIAVLGARLDALTDEVRKSNTASENMVRDHEVRIREIEKFKNESSGQSRITGAIWGTISAVAVFLVQQFISGRIK